MNSLADLLVERERELCRPLTPADSRFVDAEGKPLSKFRIQQKIRDVRDKTGIDPLVPGKRVYRARSHELRDFFKSMCANAEVPEMVSEFLLGHNVDPLEYNRFQQTK